MNPAPSSSAFFDLRDLRWVGLVAILLAISPATGASRPLVSIALGLAGGTALLGLRIWRRRREGPPPPRSLPFARPTPWVWGALGAIAIAFAPTVVWLGSEYTTSIWRNVHGVFIPVFMFLLARSALRRDPFPDRVEESAWGFVFLIAGLGLAVWDAGARTSYLGAIGLVLCLPGLSLLFLGARRTRLLVAPLILGLFLLPSPEWRVDPLWLAEGSAKLAEPLIRALGIPAIRYETHFATRLANIGISANCSGLSAFHAALATSIVLSASARNAWGRIAPLLLAYPLTLSLNALRVVFIVGMSHLQGDSFLATPLHGLSGLFVIWPVIGVLWLLSDRKGLREALS